MTLRTIGSLSLAVMLAVTPARAQQAPASAAPDRQDVRSPNVPLMVVSGAGAGLAGFVVGGFVSSRMEPTVDLGESIAVATLVGSATLPAGVHVVNGRRGNYPLAALASLSIGVAGLLVASRGEDHRVPEGALVAIPIAQLISSVLIEVRTSR